MNESLAAKLRAAAERFPAKRLPAGARSPASVNGTVNAPFVPPPRLTRMFIGEPPTFAREVVVANANVASASGLTISILAELGGPVGGAAIEITHGEPVAAAVSMPRFAEVYPARMFTEVAALLAEHGPETIAKFTSIAAVVAPVLTILICEPVVKFWGNDEGAVIVYVTVVTPEHTKLKFPPIKDADE